MAAERLRLNLARVGTVLLGTFVEIKTPSTELPNPVKIAIIVVALITELAALGGKPRVIESNIESINKEATRRKVSTTGDSTLLQDLQQEN